LIAAFPNVYFYRSTHSVSREIGRAREIYTHRGPAAMLAGHSEEDAMLGLFAIGIAVGTVSGMVGIGGGLFLVPILHYVFKFSQHEAQGTSLAVLVPPIGIFAALEYYRRGYVRLPVVMYIAIGFAVGAFVGAVIAGQIDSVTMRRGFGLLMFFISTQMIFGGAEAKLQAVLPTAAATAAIASLAWFERRFAMRTTIRRRLERWIRRRRPPRQLDDKIEYHI